MTIEKFQGNLDPVGWFIMTPSMILGTVNTRSYPQKFYQKPVERTNSGIPKGAVEFNTREEAERELAFLTRLEFYPFFTAIATVEFIRWR